MCIFACCGAIGGEDGSAVAVGVIVDYRNRFVKVVSLQDDKHWSEDLLCVTLHVGLERTAERSHHNVSSRI